MSTLATDLDLVELVRCAFARSLDRAVSVDDDFFGLGGDSITGIAVIGMLEEALDVNLDLTGVLSYPTPRLLGEAIRDGTVVEPAIVAEAPAGATGRQLAATPYQQAQLLVAHAEPGGGHLAWVYQLNGRLDPAALAAAIDDVVRRYDVLRTRLERDGEALHQVVTPFQPGVLRIVDAAGQDKLAAIEAALASVTATFDSLPAGRDTRLQAVLHRIDPKTHVLAMFVAEAVVDGDSGTLLAAELSRAYAARAGVAPPPSLPRASDGSHLDYVATHPLHDEVARRAREHWTRQAADLPSLSGWPTGDRGTVATWDATWTPEHGEHLLAAARTLRTTPYAVVLAGLVHALTRLTGTSRLLVTTVVSDRSDPVTERMIGNFSSIVRLVVTVDPAGRFAGTASRVAAAVREAVAHSAVPAPLACTAVGASATPADAVHFYFFDSRQGPVLTGTRQRRFRLSQPGATHALRVNCARRPDGTLAFFLSSSTAPADLLGRLGTRLLDVLGSVVAASDATYRDPVST